LWKSGKVHGSREREKMKESVVVGIKEEEE
jgi:hypothetical protein